jgi:hypothetical protein
MDESSINSLKERCLLLEKEISKLKAKGARLYILQMSLLNEKTRVDPTIISKYDAVVSMLTDTQAELKQVEDFLS